MRKFKVIVNGGRHHYVEAKNAFEAAKEASGIKSLKKQDLDANQPAGYAVSVYAAEGVSVKVVEG